jgi:hypothetical protein
LRRFIISSHRTIVLIDLPHHIVPVDVKIPEGGMGYALITFSIG